MEKSDRVPHVLAAPLFLKGHEIPLLHLCRHLAQHGCKVSVLLVDIGDYNSSRDPSLSFHTLPGVAKQQIFTSTLSVFQTFQELGDQVVALWKDRGVTCLLTDVLVAWGKHVADALAVPWVCMWTSTVTELVVYYNIPRLISENKLTGLTSTSPVSIPGLPDITPGEYSTLTRCTNVDGFVFKPILDIFIRNVQLTKSADRVLLNSAMALEENAIRSLQAEGVNAVPVGPLHLLAAQDSRLAHEDDPNEVLPWLDHQSPASVLYVAFGTLAPVRPQQIEQLALALEQADTPFVWVVKPEQLQHIMSEFCNIAQYRLREKVQAASSGMDKLGLVTDWVPQPKVLEHPAVLGFVTHCGWNSVLESVAAGVPMITRPIIADQVLTSKMLKEQWGVSVRICQSMNPEGVVEKAEVELAIQELKENAETLKMKVVEMRRMVRECMKEHGGSSFANVEALVKDLRTKKLD